LTHVLEFDRMTNYGGEYSKSCWTALC